MSALDVRLGLAPPRASRRPRLRTAPLVASAVLLVLFERGVVALLPELAKAQERLLHLMWDGPTATVPFLAAELAAPGFTLRFPSYLELLAWALAAAVLGVVVAELPRPALPVRLVLAFEALLVGLGAVTCMWTGRPPFRAAELAALVAETGATVLLVLPVLVGLLSLAFPFRVQERAALVAAVLAYSLVLGAVRSAFFAAVLETAGSVLMAPLYLTAGPLLDVVAAVALFSVALARVSRRQAALPAEEAWTWS